LIAGFVGGVSNSSSYQIKARGIEHFEPGEYDDDVLADNGGTDTVETLGS